MHRFWFVAAVLAGLSTSQPAFACRIRGQTDLGDVHYADVVVVGRISNYRIIRDQAFRKRMLSNPNLTPDMRETYEGQQSLLPDYARFDIEVAEVLVGTAPNRLSATWDNSTFGEPENMPPGPFLIALRNPSSPTPPLRGPSATIFPNAHPVLPTLLQAPCANPFLFENDSDLAAEVRRILGVRQPER
ncbi:hypothetical protein [Brevundimonas sp.]|uniref:hypothetical protein n=1 Tax=Brevundimonas sp. TaxID=1871086 RepID=UPI002FC96D95